MRDAAAADDPSKQAAEGLLEEIQFQSKIVAAALLLAQPEKAAEPIQPVTPVRDPLRNYVTGWLESTGGILGSPRGFQLTKGGQVLFTVRCTSGRYDLAMFDGYEVALAGPADRPDPESLRFVDVERLQVLGKSTR